MESYGKWQAQKNDKAPEDMSEPIDDIESIITETNQVTELLDQDVKTRKN